MINPSNERPLRLNSGQLIVEQLTTEVMVFDKNRNKAFCLNPTAAFVWNQCDGQTTIEEIAARSVGSSVGELAAETVRFALETLWNDGLLEPASFQPEVPAAITRRSLIQKFGKAAAISLPIVTALAVATPKAHASSGHGHHPPPPPPHRGPHD